MPRQLAKARVQTRPHRSNRGLRQLTQHAPLPARQHACLARPV